MYHYHEAMYRRLIGSSPQDDNPRAPTYRLPGETKQAAFIESSSARVIRRASLERGNEGETRSSGEELERRSRRG